MTIPLHCIRMMRFPYNGYNPSGMEEDGVYPEALSWTYGEVPQDGINENYYHYSRRPSLRHNICNKFETILGSCSVAGGFTYELMKRITANSNAYANRHKKENRFAGSLWKPILVEEMHHALGIILKMSIDNRQIGGINDYFSPPLELDYGPGR